MSSSAQLSRKQRLSVEAACLDIVGAPPLLLHHRLLVRPPFGVRRGIFKGVSKWIASSRAVCRAIGPEVNVLIPAGRLDSSGVPDYNTVVEIIAHSPRASMSAKK